MSNIDLLYKMNNEGIYTVYTPVLWLFVGTHHVVFQVVVSESHAVMSGCVCAQPALCAKHGLNIAHHNSNLNS